MQFTTASLTERCFSTSGTWTRSLYLRNCSFDGNLEFSSGAVSGTGSYTVADGFLGISNNDNFIKVNTGTVEFRTPSQALPPVLQTGGVFVASNVPGWLNNNSVTTSIFGGTGFAYKGTSVALGACFLYLVGQGNNIVDSTTWGKVSIGANVVYAFNDVNYDTSLATLAGTPLFAVAPNPNGVQAMMSRPQWGYLTTPSSVTAANQLGVILDSTNGNVYTTSSFDAGVY
jgi:hypothetical protein